MNSSNGGHAGRRADGRGGGATVPILYVLYILVEGRCRSGSDLLLGEKKGAIEGSAYQMREHRGQFVVSGAIAMYGRDCLAKA